VLMTQASVEYTAAFLAGCTMVTSAEPCAMCAGAAYWAGVGRVVYGLSERELGALIGRHPENLTMDLPCRIVLGAGQRAIEVVGPLLEDEARAVHVGFWR
jgi:tRNA(Arg) A34 adenosine deaminase TadA